MSITVIVADDHQIFRQGLTSLIRSKSQFDLVGEASTGEEAWKLVRKEKPAILVCDVSMPDYGAGSVFSKIKAAQLPTKVIALTVHDEPMIAKPLIQAGIHGYVCKSSAFEDLEWAIDQAQRGRRFISDEVVDQFVADPNDQVPLSQRELEVLQRIAAGEPYKQIAYDLNISVRTVETYRSRLLKKLDLETTADLIRYASQHPQI